jgi:hypothetical protein
MTDTLINAAKSEGTDFIFYFTAARPYVNPVALTNKIKGFK